MAILKMSHLTVLGMREDYAGVLDTLTELGVLDVHPILSSTKATDEEEIEFATEEAKQANLEATAKLRKLEEAFIVDDRRNAGREAAIAKTSTILARLEQSIDYLSRKWPLESTVFDDQTVLTPDAFLATESRVDSIVEKLVQVEKAMADANQLLAHRVQLEQEKAMLTPWRGVDVPLNLTETGRTAISLGQVADARAYQSLTSRFAQYQAPISFITLKQLAKGQLLVAVICLKENNAEVKQILQGSVFLPFALVGKKGTPDECLTALDEKMATLEQSITDNAILQEELSANQLDFCVLYDYLAARTAMAAADRNVAETKRTFTLGGYVPSHEVSAFTKTIQEKHGVAVAVREALPAENPPVKLKNSWFNQAYEILLEMFGAPSPDEADPMPIMAPFTWLFFGMMLSDVGYGLLLSLGCLFMIRVKKVKGNVRRTCTMLLLSGISATIWGFMFGGFFGDIVTAVTGKTVNFPTLWFNPIEKPMELMVYSMLIGIVHLYLALFLAMVNSAKKGDLIGGILDNAPWYFIVTGIGLLLGGDSLATFVGPGVASTLLVAGKWMAIGGAGIILLFAGRTSKNPIVRLLRGLGSLYSITSWIGDVLSYTRILALVLATSVIATVVNMLGTMAGGGVVGWIIFALVAVFGHIMNLSLSSLSAYVHSIRLQYVEFFGRFFNGGGEYYAPLGFEPKYITIEKESAMAKSKS